MANKSKNAFGPSANIENAIQSGAINAYDILFLDGDTEPKVGWVDKNGTVRIVEDKQQVVKVDELPSEDGVDNVIYIYNGECYIWDGNQYTSTSKSADLTELETQVSELETQLGNKVDVTTVQSMIEEYSEAATEVVEF